MRLLFLITITTITSCRTVSEFNAWDHVQMMRQCSNLCKGNVRSYEPLTGECQCRVPQHWEKN